MKIYIDKSKVKIALNQITREEFNDALQDISEKALTWDRLPIRVL